MTIFGYSQSGRHANAQIPPLSAAVRDACQLPENVLRKVPPLLPEVSELDVVRYFTRLSQKNFSIDTHFYPLGSCTMKYNPRGVHRLAMLPEFLQRHPYAMPTHSQGILSCLYELQEMLCDITGMKAVSLTGIAGAQGEFAGVAMIKAYHRAMGQDQRDEILVPDAAHGTNPASAVMCGYRVREIPTGADGDLDVEALREAVGPQTAGIMLTNPSTLGVFDRKVQTIQRIIHEAGGLLYYDGANLNAILGRVRPGDMGFDVMHLNLHKTFATPHGGGGPGSGPVAAGEKLAPFLPVPRVGFHNDRYMWLDQKDCPETIGQLSAFMGNALVNLRAYIYIKMLGKAGLQRVSQFATLNANYLMVRLKDAGFTIAYPDRRATHEFLITFQQDAITYHVTAMDIAKRLLDYGFHAPTTYFPLLVPECFLIEPTETETKQTLDRFVDAMISIVEEVKQDTEKVRRAPHTLPVGRVDEVKAARDFSKRITARRRDEG